MVHQNLFNLLAGNVYPGRGIVIGLSPNGKNAVIAYFIMGRSAGSRSRAFVKNGNDLDIHILNASKAMDTSLILYSPLRTLSGLTIITNGDQTDTIRDALTTGKTFEQALETRSFEPDAPHFTPRISGILRFADGFSYKLSILKSGDADGKATLRQTFAYKPVAGIGHLIHTYDGDGKVLPSFSGEPKPVSILDEIDTFANGMWNTLNANNKISLYVRYTDIQSDTYEDRLFNLYGTEENKA